MKHLSKYIFLLPTAFLLTSCQFSGLSAEELQEYARDPSNGLVKEKQLQGVSFNLSLVPSELMARRSLQADSHQLTNKALLAEYNQQLYFRLRMSAGGHDILSVAANNGEVYSRLVNQFAHGARDKAFLTTSGGDTLVAANFHFPRYYGMAPHTELLYVFPKPELENSEWVKFHLLEMGLKTGNVQFKYQTGQLLKIPSLNFKS